MLASVLVFCAISGGLQLAVAALLLRKGSAGVTPFRLSCAWLLGVNGVAALILATGNSAPSVGSWFAVFDGASGPLLLACGLSLMRGLGNDRFDRFGWVVVGVAGGGIAAFSLVTILVGPQAVAGILYDVLHTVPAMVGLGLCAWGNVRSLVRDSAVPPRQAGLVALAFLPVAGQVAFASGNALLTELQGVPWHQFPRVAAEVSLVGLMGVALVGLARARVPRAAAWRAPLALACIAAVLLQLAVHTTAGAAPFFLVYVASTLTFYVVRPLALAFAVGTAAAARTLYRFGCLAVLLVMGKTGASAAFGTPAFEFHGTDLVGLALGLLLVPIAWNAPRWITPATKPPSGQSADERLAKLLVESYRHSDGPQPADKQVIHVRTGITENNVAAAVRRLERRLDANAPPGTFVVERAVGVRGRKQYLLTPQGWQRLVSDRLVDTPAVR